MQTQYKVLQQNKQKGYQLVGPAKRCTTNIRPKADGGDIFGGYSNLDKCWLEVPGDVISTVAVE